MLFDIHIRDVYFDKMTETAHFLFEVNFYIVGVFIFAEYRLERKVPEWTEKPFWTWYRRQAEGALPCTGDQCQLS